MAFTEFVMKLLLFQGVVTGTGENSEFGEVFKMMKAEEVCNIIKPPIVANQWQKFFFFVKLNIFPELCTCK